MKLKRSLITRQTMNAGLGICSRSCVESCIKSTTFPYSPYSSQLQVTLTSSRQKHVLTPQPGSDNLTILPWIPSSKSASMTSRTQHRRVPSHWRTLLKLAGYLTLIAHCTSSPVIQLESYCLTNLNRFGSYWDSLKQDQRIESVIMDFVKQKLLDGPTVLKNDNRAGSLACLSTRFALEFNMATPRNVAHAQVERHMRLCTAATSGLEKLITIPSSEPILAEASYELMKDGMNAVWHLHHKISARIICDDQG